jgi:hypothetical protein
MVSFTNLATVPVLTLQMLPASCFLPSMRRFGAPTILGIRGSLRCVVSLLLSWESQLTSAHSHRFGPLSGPGPPSGCSSQKPNCIQPMQTFLSPTNVQHKSTCKVSKLHPSRLNNINATSFTHRIRVFSDTFLSLPSHYSSGKPSLTKLDKSLK